MKQCLVFIPLSHRYVPAVGGWTLSFRAVVSGWIMGGEDLEAWFAAVAALHGVSVGHGPAANAVGFLLLQFRVEFLEGGYRYFAGQPEQRLKGLFQFPVGLVVAFCLPLAEVFQRVADALFQREQRLP